MQSGNVVFTSRAAPATLEKKLEDEIEKQLGVDPKVVVRTRDELAAAIEANPFAVPDNPKNLHVTFLSGKPEAAAAKTLEDADLGDDELAFLGREIYILYANGMGRSELAKQLGRAKLGVAATDRTGTRSRNCWRWLTRRRRVQHARRRPRRRSRRTGGPATTRRAWGRSRTPASSRRPRAPRARRRCAARGG